MTRSDRLNKLQQLKRAKDIVTQLESDLKADTSTPPVKQPVKATTKREPVDQITDLLISNRVAVESDEPTLFTSNQTAKLL